MKMTRQKFGMLFIVTTALIFIGINHFGLAEEVSKFIVIIALVAYFAGQYSMRLPKE